MFSAPQQAKLTNQPFLSHNSVRLPQAVTGRLHILHRNPFERAMRVVLTAKEVGGRPGPVQ